MIQYCSECGAKLTPGDRFCSECGAPVADTPGAVTPAAPGRAAPPAAPAPSRPSAPPPRAPAPEPEPAEAEPDEAEPEAIASAAAAPGPRARKSLLGRLFRIVLIFMALSAVLGLAVTALNHFAQLGWSVPWLNIGAPPPPKPEGPVRVIAIGNAEVVQNGPRAPSRLRTTSPIFVKSIQTYHWNNGQGRTPGTIGLKAADGRIYGPWRATGQPGANGVANAYWVVHPQIVVPAGDYEIVDSDPWTWATNASAGNRGFYKMEWQAVRQDGKP
jgi:hypothetical protein